ncbi:D-amino acid dehydrogenase [Candidatus Zinderia endosymbiont of Aphrophora alni]|uniref:D-amino acid dehydrogenase n=1 Tax=Candidatus Zinderia endosymbiont of Aphrophora alni TaxID=3077951 RepID=UPI0030D28435
MKIIILGAGIIGITSAWFLNKEGHKIIIIDRQSGVAQETSFANGCQISESNSEPWSNPLTPFKILKWINKKNSPIYIKMKLKTFKFKWIKNFLNECFPFKTVNNCKQILSLCQYSKKILKILRKKTNINYDHLKNGILKLYTKEEDFKSSIPIINLMNDLGCKRKILNIQDILNIEPSLKNNKKNFFCGDFTNSDESGNIYKMAIKLTKILKKKGVIFNFNTTITKIIKKKKYINKIETINKLGFYKNFKADIYLITAGINSKFLLKPIGINLLMYPIKGYSATYKIINFKKTPNISIIDDKYKLVISRLKNKLRIAGICELNGYLTRELNKKKCEFLTKRIKKLFPKACNYKKPKYWAGIRPLTPTNIPYIGKTKFKNLFLNTGHGALGWTMSFGSGFAISEIISNRLPNINFNFLGIKK